MCALGAERLEVEGSQLMGARIALGLANIDGCLGLKGHEQLAELVAVELGASGVRIAGSIEAILADQRPARRSEIPGVAIHRHAGRLRKARASSKRGAPPPSSAG